MYQDCPLDRNLSTGCNALGASHHFIHKMYGLPSILEATNPISLECAISCLTRESSLRCCFASLPQFTAILLPGLSSADFRGGVLGIRVEPGTLSGNSTSFGELPIKDSPSKYFRIRGPSCVTARYPSEPSIRHDQWQLELAKLECVRRSNALELSKFRMVRFKLLLEFHRRNQMATVTGGTSSQCFCIVIPYPHFVEKFNVIPRQRLLCFKQSSY